MKHSNQCLIGGWDSWRRLSQLTGQRNEIPQILGADILGNSLPKRRAWCANPFSVHHSKMKDEVQFSAFLDKHQRVRFIHLQWLDYTSTLRSRVLTVIHMRHLICTGQCHGLGPNYMTLIDSDAPLASNDTRGVIGQNYLIPDLSSLHASSWDDEHAGVFCFFGEDKIVNGTLQPGINERCPRHSLFKRVEETASKGLRFLVGFETEFACFYRGKNTLTASEHTVHQASGSRTLQKMMLPILSTITKTLESEGIVVEHFHAEAEENQFELTTGCCAPLEAVDKLITTREVIHRICMEHDMDVSFHPMAPVCNGLHLNLSLERSTDMDDTINDHFLAGIFDHLSAIFAFAFPHPESYVRTGSGRHCVGRYKAWGTQNREVPVRRKGSAFWEMRFLDATTNVYLCLAAILCAGVAGIKSSSKLTLGDCTSESNHRATIRFADVSTVDTAMVSDSERRDHGITEELPRDPEEAFLALSSDELYINTFGHDLVYTYVSLMTHYNVALANIGPIDSLARQQWLTARL
jgi:glutamine synthetase